MSAFEEAFREVVYFTDGTLVVSGGYSRTEAHELFEYYLGEAVGAEHLSARHVRYGFAPEGVEDLVGENCWYTCSPRERGAKGVWTL